MAELEVKARQLGIAVLQLDALLIAAQALHRRCGHMEVGNVILSGVEGILIRETSIAQQERNEPRVSYVHTDDTINAKGSSMLDNGACLLSQHHPCMIWAGPAHRWTWQ